MTDGPKADCSGGFPPFKMDNVKFVLEAESDGVFFPFRTVMDMLRFAYSRCKALEAENEELRTSLEHLENLRSKGVARDSGA